MATMVAVDLGAQSGRVALGRFDGERLAVSTAAPLPERARAHARDAALGRPAALRRRSRRAARGRTRRRSRRLRRCRLLGRRLRAARPRRAARPEPGPLPRHAARGAMDGVLAKVPARELYERTGIQLMPINTRLRAGRDGRRARPGAGGRGDAAHDPRPDALLARRAHGLRVHERDDDAVLRRARRRRGRATCWSGSTIPTGLLPEVVAPATALAPLAADVAEETGLDGAIGRGAARRTTPPPRSQRSRSAARARRSSAPAPGRSSGSSCPGRVIDDRTLRREPHQRGRRRRHRARPAQRHRSVAAARVPPRLGARGLRPLLRGARRPRRRPRRSCARSSTRTIHCFAAPDDMPRQDPRVLREDRPAGARRTPRPSCAASSRALR